MHLLPFCSLFILIQQMKNGGSCQHSNAADKLPCSLISQNNLLLEESLAEAMQRICKTNDDQVSLDDHFYSLNHLLHLLILKLSLTPLTCQKL